MNAIVFSHLNLGRGLPGFAKTPLHKAAAGVLALTLATCAGVNSAWSQPAQPSAARQTAGQAAASDPVYWFQRWHHAATQYPYMGTVTVTQAHEQPRSARVWHGVRKGQPHMDRIDMLSDDAPRTVLRRGRDMAVQWHEKGRHRHAMHEAPPVGMPFLLSEQMEQAQLRQIAQYYRVVPLGRQRVANYQAEAIGFLPADNLRMPYRFWTEQQTGLLLKWQMLDMQRADKPAWDKARVLQEIAFADVQIPAPVDYAMLQNLMQEIAASQEGRRPPKSPSTPAAPGSHRLPTTSLQEQGWVWRKPLPGYTVKQCYWRRLGGGPRKEPRKEGPPPAPAEQPVANKNAAQPRLLQCLVTDGLSHFSVFIGPQLPPPPAHAPKRMQEEGAGVRMASRMYANSHKITAVGAVPQAALQHAVEALYRP